MAAFGRTGNSVASENFGERSSFQKGDFEAIQILMYLSKQYEWKIVGVVDNNITYLLISLLS